MKNWEFYKEELNQIGVEFAIVQNKMVNCTTTPCKLCKFFARKNSCENKRLQFLYQEHEEDKLVLTPDEQALCNWFGNGYIARDEDGELYLYETKPKKVGDVWLILGFLEINLTHAFPQCKFDFIKWEDKEPWEVQINV